VEQVLGDVLPEDRCSCLPEEEEDEETKMSNLIHLNDENFDAVVGDGDLPVLVDFSAGWCGPCKALSPIVEKLADEVVGKAKVCKVDIDEAPQAAKKHGIRSVPTVIVFKDGKAFNTSVGLKSKEKLVEMLGL
jgi:thioredoxin 1